MFEAQAYSKLEGKWIAVKAARTLDEVVAYGRERLNPRWETRVMEYAYVRVDAGSPVLRSVREVR